MRVSSFIRESQAVLPTTEQHGGGLAAANRDLEHPGRAKLKNSLLLDLVSFDSLTRSRSRRCASKPAASLAFRLPCCTWSRGGGRDVLANGYSVRSSCHHRRVRTHAVPGPRQVQPSLRCRGAGHDHHFGGFGHRAPAGTTGGQPLRWFQVLPPVAHRMSYSSSAERARRS